MPTPSSIALAKLFGFIQQETVAIIGSGGKTTLLWYLAEAFRQERVLVTPTTKLFLPPSASSTSYDRFCDLAAFTALSPVFPNSPDLPVLPDFSGTSDTSLKGITLAGNMTNDSSEIPSKGPVSSCSMTAQKSESFYTQALSQSDSSPAKAQGETCLKAKKRRDRDDPTLFAHKITPFPQDLLARQRFLFDKVFMECDGARNLPLKGWSSSEPVIPPFTSMVIGVIPLWGIGLQASETTIHRPERFYAMTGCQEGDVVTLEHLARAIVHPNGLLAKAGSRNIILFLHSDQGQPTRTDCANYGSHDPRGVASQLVALLPQKTVQQTNRIIVGSAREGWGHVFWAKDGF